VGIGGKRPGSQTPTIKSIPARLVAFKFKFPLSRNTPCDRRKAEAADRKRIPVQHSGSSGQSPADVPSETARFYTVLYHFAFVRVVTKACRRGIRPFGYHKGGNLLRSHLRLRAGRRAGSCLQDGSLHPADNRSKPNPDGKQLELDNDPFPISRDEAPRRSGATDWQTTNRTSTSPGKWKPFLLGKPDAQGYGQPQQLLRSCRRVLRAALEQDDSTGPHGDQNVGWTWGVLVEARFFLLTAVPGCAKTR